MKNLFLNKSLGYNLVLGFLGGIFLLLYLKHPLKIGWFNGYIIVLVYLFTIYLSMFFLKKYDVQLDNFAYRILNGTLTFAIIFFISNIDEIKDEYVNPISFFLINIGWSIVLGLILSSVISSIIWLKRKFIKSEWHSHKKI